MIADGGAWQDDALAAAVEAELRAHFAPLETDLEVFNTEPHV